MIDDKLPLVSILCDTYNHEKYIAQALDGFIMQKTNFPFEIIVHDDASTDRTAQIIKEYEIKYPDLIMAIYQTVNQYSQEDVNIWADITFPKARGKYIALCEGDDYWTDPYKLQRQVNFLEANSDFSLCFHKVKIKAENKLIKDYLTKVPKEVSIINDLAKRGNYIHTCSVVFKNPKKYEVPPDIVTGDYALYLLITKDGSKIKYFNEVMSVYRMHKLGVWSFHDKVDKVKKEILFISIMSKTLPTEPASLLLYRLFIIFTNNYASLKNEEEKNSLLQFMISKTDIIDKNFLLALLVFKNELTSRSYFFHVLKEKLVRGFTR